MVEAEVIVTVPTDGILESIDENAVATNLTVPSCCKITVLPNPVAFDSCLIALPDYSCKRVIQRKKKPQPDKDRLSVAASNSVTSSVTNLDDALSANSSSIQLQQDEENKKHIQFVDEFSAPFSWFPQNGFSYFNFACSKQDKKSPDSPEKIIGQDEAKLTSETNEPDGVKIVETTQETDDGRIVKLSDIKKRAIEEARRRKTDPVAWENVKKPVNKRQQPSSSSSGVRAQSRLNIQLVSSSSANSPALSTKALKIAPSVTSLTSSPIIKSRVSNASSATTVTNESAPLRGQSHSLSVSSSNASSALSTSSRKPLLIHKTDVDTRDRVATDSKVVKSTSEILKIERQSSKDVKFDSALTLTSDVEGENSENIKTSQSSEPLRSNSADEPVALSTVKVVYNDLKAEEEENNKDDSKLTISEEYGENKIGGATSYEFLLEW